MTHTPTEGQRQGTSRRHQDKTRYISLAKFLNKSEAHSRLQGKETQSPGSLSQAEKRGGRKGEILPFPLNLLASEKIKNNIKVGLESVISLASLVRKRADIIVVFLKFTAFRGNLIDLIVYEVRPRATTGE